MKYLNIVGHVVEYILLIDGFCFIDNPYKPFKWKTVAGLLILDIFCEKENICNSFEISSIPNDSCDY